MHIKKVDLFFGMADTFVDKLMATAVEKSFNKGEILFRANTHATYFYILLEGRIGLRLAETNQIFYTVEQAGDVFGWSSIIGRDVHTATAECLESATLLMTDRREFQEILDADPVNGLQFFKRLAGIFGNRWLQIYSNRSEATPPPDESTDDSL